MNGGHRLRRGGTNAGRSIRCWSPWQTRVRQIGQLTQLPMASWQMHGAATHSDGSARREHHSRA